ncbi:uncharacterized protein LOC142591064 isoform X1 [Dermacentor variabilis]|uniref:uncharacterized protein LOC142591064 isoform X1 n=1 Tax=Dermacentor variabilis TaxID=34621 RepID=UPI003F5CAB90
MKNVPSSLVIAVVGVLLTIEVTEQAKVLAPTPFKNGKCHFRGGEYKDGEAMYEIKQCVKWICFRDNSTHGTMVGLGVPSDRMERSHCDPCSKTRQRSFISGKLPPDSPHKLHV